VIDNVFSIYRRLPAGWQTLPLGYLASDVKKKNKWLEEENLLSLSYGKIIRKDITASEGLLPESFDGYNIIEAGDLVLRLTDLQNDKRSLRTGLAHERGIITSAYTTIRPIGLDPRWLSYTLHAYDIQKVFYSLGSGLRQSMKYEDLKSIPIALPPIEEQRRIADYLDEQVGIIDSMIEIHKLVEFNIKELTVSERDILIRGASANRKEIQGWLGYIDADWNTIRLGQITDIKSGVGFPDDYQGKPSGDYPFMKVGDLGSADEKGYIASANNFVDFREVLELGARIAPAGTIIFPKVGAALLNNRRVILSTNSIFDNNVMGLLFKEGNTRYWYHVLRAIDMGRIMNPGPVPSIGASQVSEIQLPFPEFAVQETIATRLDEIDLSEQELVSTNSAAIEKLRELKTSLITAAVTGQFNVTTGRSVA
jgi:type I restriction enzyme S subunit